MTPAPRDLVILLAVVFATFSFQFFRGLDLIPYLLRLTPEVWQRGFVWQVATYPLSGYGGPSIWILLELLILYWFGRDVYFSLGRRRFWRTLGTVAVLAGVAAVLVEVASRLLAPGGASAPAFTLMQGQRTLLAFAIAAFATLHRHATILLFFVLPIQARWFLWLEILFAFIAFLGTKDLAGFVGICVVVGGTYSLLTAGGLGRVLRRWRLTMEERRVRAQLERERKKRKLRVLDGGERGGGDERGGGADSRQGPWVH